MKTKLSILKTAASEGRWQDALRIAARFPVLGDHKAAIVRAHEAFENDRFYKQIGRDTDQLIRDGIAALCDRYKINPEGEEIMTIETKLTGAEVARLTAVVEGESGYKRSASKDKAIDRLITAVADRIGGDAKSDVEKWLKLDFDAAVSAIKTEIAYADNDAVRHAAADSPGMKKAKAVNTAVHEALKKANRAADKSPRPGTMAHTTFKLMLRKSGATAKEVVEAGGMNESLSDVVIKFADRFGYTAKKEADGRAMRYFLTA